MSCLTDYIGLKDCSNAAPESGLYINTLPGISLQSMDSIATVDQITYKGLWSDAQEEAYNEFYSGFFAAVSNCYTVNAYCDYDNLICLNKKILALPWRYMLGYQLMFYRKYTNRMNYFTLMTSDQAEDLMAEYQKKYAQSLKNSMKLIDVSSCCLPCGGDPKIVVALP